MSNFGNMDLSEAKKILNLDAIDDREALQEATDRLVNVSRLLYFTDHTNIKL